LRAFSACASGVRGASGGGGVRDAFAVRVNATMRETSPRVRVHETNASVPW
jgi:hypothetical protein